MLKDMTPQALRNGFIRDFIGIVGLAAHMEREALAPTTGDE
jgi:hypothetical protein